ncbi:MAG: large subunit ribosomal protein L15e [Thermoplasmata archaeon]|jgi:large subunit ribosomal protein L15e|nr:large subunit ribosomal protein L15e [Thermoplasmata archaeon]
MPNAYHHIGEAWKRHEKTHGSAQWNRLVEWRESESFARVEKPLRLDRARALGYKAKQGIIVVRARVRRGGLHKKRFVQGRVPSKMGVAKITMRQNTQAIAEVRTSKHYPNLEVLNSYWVGEDGKHHYYEVILVDPFHPAIQSDKHLAWICTKPATNRVLRGKTAAGQRHRGLRWKGTGSEHTRPSVSKSGVRRKDKLLWKRQDQARRTKL